MEDSMSRKILVLVSFFASLLASTMVLSQDSLRVVLKGHDPVAYFTDGKPVKGDPAIRYDWDEGRYLFASADHRAMFVADPDRYAPQFGGYCTGSMAKGVTSNEGHPEAWVVSDGKLYVFGAPDLATAQQTRERALNDPDYLRARVPKAAKVWAQRSGS
jgi:hypothetical protein